MVTTTIPTLISIDLHMYKDALPESNTITSGANSGAQIQGRTRARAFWHDIVKLVMTKGGHKCNLIKVHASATRKRVYLGEVPECCLYVSGTIKKCPVTGVVCIRVPGKYS